MLFRMIHGVQVTHWIRSEHVFDDVRNFIQENLHPVDPAALEHAKELPTKLIHNTVHPFDSEQVAKLYAMNPHWSDVEKTAYPAV